MLDELRTTDDEIRSVMVVGHNPTANALAFDDGPGAGGRTGRGFPTCALAVYRLPVDRWFDVAEGTGKLVGLYAPP